MSQIFQPNSEENSGLIGTVLNGINSQKRNSLHGRDESPRVPRNEMSPSCLTSPTSMNSCFYQSCDTGEDGMESDDTDARSNARNRLDQAIRQGLSNSEIPGGSRKRIRRMRRTTMLGSGYHSSSSQLPSPTGEFEQIDNFNDSFGGF